MSIYRGSQLISGNSANPIQKQISDLYDTTKNYVKEDFCIYNNSFYKCIAPTNGIWDAEKWRETNVTNELLKVFQSVSNGKGEIASAITDMGVNMETDAEFQTIAEKIHEIRGVFYDSFNLNTRIATYTILE